jgi:hypothetical protein
MPLLCNAFFSQGFGGSGIFSLTPRERLEGSSEREGVPVPIKSVVEYIENAERELVEADASSGHSTESRYHVDRAQVFATLAVAKATYDHGD